MEVTFKCPHCNAPYKAPDHLIGRRIRCRHCGEAITVARPGEESQEISSGGELGEGEPPDLDYGGLVDPLDLAESLSPQSHRTNTPLRYPLAPWIDDIAPWVISAGGVLAVFVMAQRAYGSEGWISLTRSVLALGLYCGVVWPISLLGLKRGMDRSRLGLPPRHVLRSFACFVAPYALGYFVWSKTGSVGGMMVGLLVGLVIAMGLIVVFFRLHMRDLALSLCFSVIAFIFSAALASGGVYGANVTLVSVLNFYKVASAPAASPLAPQMPWEIVAPPPAPATPPSKIIVPPTKTVPPLIGDSPRVQSVEVLAQRSFEEVIHPLVSSNFAALVYRNSAGEDGIQMMDFLTRRVMAEASFRHAEGAKDRYIIGPWGDCVARIVDWPKLSAQIWSFPEARVLWNIDLTSQEGKPELIGFISGDYFLVLWRKAGEATGTMIPVNARTGEIMKQQAKSIPLEEKADEVMTVSADGRKLAVAARSNGPSLLIYDLMAEGKDPVSNLKISALDPQWAIFPTGLAFSPDAARVALYFEHNSNALLLNWDVVKGEQSLEQIYPDSPAPYADHRRFVGSSLTWLGGGEWLLYGQTLIPVSSPQAYQPLLFYQNAGANPVKIVSQHVIDPFNMELVFESSDGRKGLAMVRLIDPSHPPAAPETQPAE